MEDRSGKVYVCRHCGNVATLTTDGGGILVCCGAPMEEQKSE